MAVLPTLDLSNPVVEELGGQTTQNPWASQVPGPVSSDAWLAQEVQKAAAAMPKTVSKKGGEQKKEQTNTKKDTRQTTQKNLYANAEDFLGRADIASQLPGIADLDQSIKSQEDLLNMMQGQEVADYDWLIRPLMALTKGQTGVDLSGGYNPQNTRAQQMKTMADMRDKINAAKIDRAKLINEGVKAQKEGTQTDSMSAQMAQMMGFTQGMLAGGANGGKSVGETSVDKAFAKKYVDFVTEDYPALQQNIATMDNIVATLNSTEGLTGPRVGIIPKAVRNYSNPASADIQDQYEKIVGESLKRVLGGQFTENEAKRLFERSFNPALDQATNARRIIGVQQELQQAAEAKASAARYYEANGFSLKGYPGAKRVAIGGKTYDLGAQFGDRSGGEAPAASPAPQGQSAQAPSGADAAAQRQARIAELKAKRGG